MILDIHTHNFLGQGDIVADQAAKHGVEKFVNLGDVLRFGDEPTEEQIRKINDETIEYSKKYGDKTCGFCFMSPLLPAAFQREEIERCLDMPIFKGVKLEISLCCRNLGMEPLMEECLKYDVPLLQHTWYKTVSKYRGESDPSDVAVLAKRFPKNKIIMAHLVGCGHRGIEDIAECENVWVDTSGAQPEAGLVEYAVKRIGARRLLYGSDAPGRDFGAMIAKVQEANISDSDRELIFHTNAEELLKW